MWWSIDFPAQSSRHDDVAPNSRDAQGHGMA